MRLMRRASRWMIVVVLAALAAGLAQAQSELLQNPGLEEGVFGPYTTRRGGEKPIYLPPSWNVWLAAPTGDYYNRSDRVSIWPHPGPGPDPLEGQRALNIDCGFVTCTTAIYQQVPVQPNTNVQASAWAQVKACNLNGNSSCGSAIESGAQTRIGIDPNGGTDPNDSDVVWSNWVQPHDQWLEMRVSATTTGATATLFLYNTQANTADLNKVYWDKTSLTGGGAGGSVPGQPAATPIPTAPPEVPFVVPQGERPDGSIVHVVRPGDTIDSIAVAYRMTRADILERNNITDPRIIRIGQEILIRDPLPTAGTTLSEPVEEAEATAEAAGDALPAPAGNEPSTAPETAAEQPPAAAEAAAASTEAPAVAQAEAPAEPTTPPPPAPVVSAANGALPAADPAAALARVCALVFNDANRNRIQEPDEALLPGASLALTSGAETLGTAQTDGVADPQCFDALPAGEYVLAASAPDGFGLTSPDQLRLRLLPGIPLDVAFGAAEGLAPAAPPPADIGAPAEAPAEAETPPDAPLDQLMENSGLIIFGLAAVVLVAGLGLSLALRGR